MSPEQVEISGKELSVDVLRVRGRGLAPGLKVDALRAAHKGNHGEALLRLRITGVLVEVRGEGRLGAVHVAALHRGVSLLKGFGQRGLLRSLARGLCVHAFLRGETREFIHDGGKLLFRDYAFEQRLDLSLHEKHGRGQRLDPKCRRDARLLIRIEDRETDRASMLSQNRT